MLLSENNWVNVMNNVDTCIMCGVIIPEGRQVCLHCEDKTKAPERLSTTGIKYLNIDKGYMYVARVVIKRKHFIVWKGYNFSIGKVIAEKIQKLMLKGEATFLDWYDYEMDNWLKELKSKYKIK